MPNFYLVLDANNYACDLLEETDDCSVILKMSNVNDFDTIQNARPEIVNLVRIADNCTDRRVRIPGKTLNQGAFIIKCKAALT